MLNAFITNLGKYNEGELIGEWISFPISDEELEAVKQRIGINERYEEWFFTDYESDVYPMDKLGEYESIESLNAIAEKIEELDNNNQLEELEAALDFYGWDEAVEKVEAGEVYQIGDDDTCNFDANVGYAEVDSCGGVDQLSRETLERYFDYESFGRDCRLEGYSHYTGLNGKLYRMDA